MQPVFVRECSCGLKVSAGAIWGPNLLAATGKKVTAGL